MIISKVNSFNLGISIKDLDHSKLIFFSCLFLVITFTLKSLVTFIFNFFAAKITMNINYYISSFFFKNYLKNLMKNI